MHIVFIVGNYFPYYSAVGKCIGNVAEELAKKYKVTVICIKNSSEELNRENINNHTVIRIDTEEFIKRNIFKEKIEKSTSKYHKRKYKMMDISFRAKKNFEILLSKTSLKNELTDRYTEALKEINEPIDVIIPSSMPFESVLAAEKYKRTVDQEVIMIPYLFDQFVENSSLHRFTLVKNIKRSKHKELEINALNKSNKVLLTPHLKKYFDSNHRENKEKFLILEHPLLKKFENEDENNNDNKGMGMKFVYTGSFYKKIRNPSYMLNFMSKLLNKHKYTLFLYTFGDCNKMVNNYSDLNENIYSLGHVANNVAQNALKEADFLIAVGNRDDSQVPSKTFEYLSYGKPIIYFYTNPNDTSLEVLRKYPLALCLKQDSRMNAENEIKFVEFCKKNYKKSMKFEEIEKLFIDASPKYNAILIERAIITNK